MLSRRRAIHPIWDTLVSLGGSMESALCQEAGTLRLGKLIDAHPVRIVTVSASKQILLCTQ